ncbi:MAG TPA: hypothetical protein VEA16_12090 [Vicinamibacterales bacterium]|nr:hypothetical protein [Vicinamibacterales bacterium]
MKVTLWTGVMAAALLWPSRIIGPLDGAPLDGAAEAIAFGVIVPALWWLNRSGVTRRSTQVTVSALLAWKVMTALTMTQQGLCVSMSAGRPLDGINQGIPIVEPAGVLRSWDVRADWLDAAPRCTAIVTRSLDEQREFPAWFLNVTSQLSGPKDVLMRASGVVTTAAGAHPIDISTTLSGDTWMFAPTVEEQPIWSAGMVTTTAPNAIDRAIGHWGWVVGAMLSVAVVASLAANVWMQLTPTPLMAGGIIGLAAGAAALALAPQLGVQRLGGVATFAAVMIPVASGLRNLRGAFLLIGVPWLAFIAVLSLSQAGRFTLYSYDDWLTYQVASHRIYFQGYWLEGGNAVFDFQPLYRWMTGALHLIFGDSSVGELYWDAACVLMGALLAFHIAKGLAGFRFALAAAAATIATMTLGTPWYFLGRGLSEIAAAGWGFLAMFFLLRGRRGSIAWIIAAGVAAVLMFYTRLNHLLFALFLPAFLLSCRTPMVRSRLLAAAARIPWRKATAFAAVFGGGVLFFAWRTWYYTGVFSLFYGTSLKVNDTGLRPWTIFDSAVWGRISHSLQATVFMNEPPRPDPRAVFVAAGSAVALASLVWQRLASGVPAIAVIAAAGGTLGAFLAHAHGYPGRFTIHLLPFASALAVTGVAALWPRRAAWAAARGEGSVPAA